MRHRAEGGNKAARWAYDTRPRRIVDYQDDSTDSDSDDDYGGWSGVRQRKRARRHPVVDDGGEAADYDGVAKTLQFSDSDDSGTEGTGHDVTQPPLWTDGRQHSVERREQAGLVAADIPDDDDAAVLEVSHGPQELH